jgi:biopolymer transport protein ExbD
VKPLPPISLLPPVSSIALICSLAAALLLCGLSHIRPAPIFRGPPVLLPHTGSPGIVDELPSDIVVRLTADGNRFLETGWAPGEAFLPAVTRLRASRPSARLLVQADTRVPFRDVRQVLVDLRAIGVNSAILVVAPLAEH